MPQHRVTLVFGPTPPGTSVPGGAPIFGTTGSQYSWTESWYRNVVEPDNLCYIWADFLRLARRQLLTPGWAIKAIRLAVFPSSRTASRKYINPADGCGVLSGGSAAGTSDEQPYDTLVHAVASMSGHSRQWGARGIGPNVVAASGAYLAPANYNDALAFFTNLMTGSPAAPAPGGACIRITSPGLKNWIVSVATTGTVGGLTATPSSPVLLAQNFDATLAAGNVVRISGVLGVSGLNGQWTIASVTTTLGVSTIQLQQKRGRTLVGVYVQGGYVQKQNYTLDPIIGITASQGGSRRTGGSSLRPRGRRSRRAS